MAHNKVARRSMDSSDWIAIRKKWIKDRVVIAKKNLSGWMVQEARQIEEMNYEYLGDRHPIQNGDVYFSPDGTAFLDNEFEIPAEWQDKKVWFYFETAAEMIVKVNGSWLGGLDPNRQRICLKEADQKLSRVKIEMEGYNRSKPDDERNTETNHLRGCRQVFNSGSVRIIDDQILEAYYDASILLETINCEYIPEDLRIEIENELNKALLLIPFSAEDRAEFKEGIREFRQHLENTVLNEENSYHIGKIALVAHSHLDIAYYWRRIHTVQKNARTCLIQLDLMDQHPDFKYAHTQAYTFETLEKHFPEIFTRVKEKVKEGRFEPVGGMYIEPDCNLPTAESMVRQCLYGQHYFQDKFDLTVNNCWLPDVFGNSWILPQILKKSGMEYFVSNKMSTWNDTNRFPHNNFIWKGIDGTDVMACVPPTHFISWNTPEQVIEHWETFQDKDVCNESLNMFGYGDGGSGVTEDMLAYMERLNKISSLPETRHITGKQFLDESITSDQDLSTWDGELYLEMHRGTFTTKGYLKKMNRRFELMLRDLEYLWTAVYLKDGNYPQSEIDELWKLLLINQFHDILPGTHISPVEVDVRKDYAEIKAKISRLKEKALKIMAAKTKEDSQNKAASEQKKIKVLNTLNFDRTEAQFLAAEEFDFELEALEFKNLKTQIGCKDGKKGIWFMLEQLESLASREFELVESGENNENIDTEHHNSASWFKWSEQKLDTPFYKVKFNKDGAISSLYLKAEDKELVKENSSLNQLKLYHDYPGKYDAWDILKSYQDKEDPVMVEEEIELVEAGEVYLALKIKYRTEKSEWDQIIRFYQEDPRIDFEYRVDWHEKHRLAKAEFDFNILSRKAGCDTSAGTIYRDTHKNTSWQQARFEVCMHKYVDLYEPGLGAALINDSKYGVSIDESCLGISLLRGTVRPDNNSDMGEHRFTYALIPHQKPLEETEIIEKAWAFNVPLLKTAADFDLEAPLTIESNQLHLQSLKKAQRSEDKKEIIIRLAELKGRRGKEIIKFKQPIKTVTTVNMLEEEDSKVKEVILSRDGQSCQLEFKPNEIITLAVEY